GLGEGGTGVRDQGIPVPCSATRRVPFTTHTGTAPSAVHTGTAPAPLRPRTRCCPLPPSVDAPRDVPRVGLLQRLGQERVRDVLVADRAQEPADRRGP